MTRTRAFAMRNDSIPVYRSLAEIPADFGLSVVSIGNFDGVHLGHRSILCEVVLEARSLGAKAVAVTFDPHPEQFLRPAHALTRRSAQRD